MKRRTRKGNHSSREELPAREKIGGGENRAGLGEKNKKNGGGKKTNKDWIPHDIERKSGDPLEKTRQNYWEKGKGYGEQGMEPINKKVWEVEVKGGKN